MAIAPIKPESRPRWKTIYGQLRKEMPRFEYGSAFYTLAEVCEKFGVSKITAIRVLNELANDGLVEKIQGKGNVVRRLSQRVSIRLLVADDTRSDFRTFDPVLRRMIDGLNDAARRFDIDFSAIYEQHVPRLFPRHDEPFGFIVLRRIADETYDFLREHRLPYVQLDPLSGFGKTAHVRVNRMAAGYLATKHLLDLGHRRIAWITGPIESRHFRERLKGYRNALREEGIPFKWALIKTTGVNIFEEDAAALDELMALRRPPTAIIVGDDHRGMNVLDACKCRGINVPGDLSVMGYPNYPESSLTDPPLTVVDAHFEQVSEAAVQLLLDQMHNSTSPSRRQMLIEPTVVSRASVDRPMRRHTSGASNQ